MEAIIQKLGLSLATDPVIGQSELSNNSNESISKLDKMIIKVCERFL